MAFDGITMASLVSEMSKLLKGGRISKIAMPEKDELLITIKKNEMHRLLISAGASLPHMYLTEENKTSPATAPAFCMLLRKHIGTAVILDITQDGLERVIKIALEHRNDLGDICHKYLIVELMGKHSNIIFTDENGYIIDSIKRIPSTVSSLREVLPGRQYFLPDELRKKDPVSADSESFQVLMNDFNGSVYKGFYSIFEGISPQISSELCYLSNIDSEKPFSDLSIIEKSTLYSEFHSMMLAVASGNFNPEMILRNDIPVDFSAFHLKSLEGAEYHAKYYESISNLLEEYYASKDTYTRIRQKSSDLRRLVTNLLERNMKKYDLQHKQLKDCSDKERLKIYGNLLNTYGFNLRGGENKLVCENYYDNNKEIVIPLDEHKTASENAKRYFDRYSKLKRTEDALSDEMPKTELTINHLNSILTSLDTANSEADLNQIRKELSDYGYLSRNPVRKNDKANTLKAKPYEYTSSDGFKIYVGKNNYQNDEVTFNIAVGKDLWFHAKGCPGSHVIVKIDSSPLGQIDDIMIIPDRLFEEAAGLAAYYSSKRNSDKVEIDYTQRKNLKKTPGGPPGFVIYHTCYSIIAKPCSSIQ